MTTLTQQEGMTIRIPSYNTVYDWAALMKTMTRMHALASASEEIRLEPSDHYEYMLFMDELIDLRVDDEVD